MQGLLRAVAISESMQQHGYGKALVNRMVAEAKARGIKNLYLLTTTAPKFFEKQGFLRQNRDNIIGPIVGSVEFENACRVKDCHNNTKTLSTQKQRLTQQSK
jgi:amino-acid N-acetyltransferase